MRTVCPLPPSLCEESPFPCAWLRSLIVNLTKASYSMLPGLFPPPLAQKPLWVSTDASQEEIICVWMSGRQQVN